MASRSALHSFSFTVNACVLALMMVACGSGNPGNAELDHDGSSPTSVLETLQPIADSACVDANIDNLDRPAILNRIASNFDALSGIEEGSEESSADWMVQSKDALRQQANDGVTHFPWGPIPQNGLATYVREACDLMSAFYEYPAPRERAQKVPGAMILDAITTCTTWSEENRALQSKRTTAIEDEINAGKAGALVASLQLRYICPQLASGSAYLVPNASEIDLVGRWIGTSCLSGDPISTWTATITTSEPLIGQIDFETCTVRVSELSREADKIELELAHVNGEVDCGIEPAELQLRSSDSAMLVDDGLGGGVTMVLARQ